MKCQERDNEGLVCQYIACQLPNIQKHYRVKHEWVNTRKRGGQEKGRDIEVPWKTGVHCQHFFVRGPGAQFFEVASQASLEHRSTPSSDSGFAAAKQELATALKKAEEEERKKITEPEEAREPNPWLRRVGWASHLAGLDRDEVRELVEPVGEDEVELQVLCKAFDWMIQDAQFNAVKEVVGIHALFEANKKEVDKKPSMPFDSWMDITTVKAYTEVWKKLLRYVFRAEDDDEDKRPPYSLTQRQQAHLGELQRKIQEFQRWQEQQPAREGEEAESEEEVEWMRQVQRMVLQFCIALLNQTLQDHEYKSAIISGLAVLGMQDGEGWLDAEDYTPKYSAVIKLARLMVVQEAYQRREAEIIKYEARGLGPKEAAEAASYYQLTQGLVQRFMTMAHDHRDPTPMQWLYDSRSYGFKIRYTTTAGGKIQWIGDTVIYPDIKFSMNQVRTMVHGLVGEAKEELFQELMMMGLGEEGEVDARVPEIKWDAIIDQPSESKVGWSFLDDERNEWAVCKEWWMFQRMYEDPRVRERFLDPAGNLKEAVTAYQRHITRFRELLC